VADKHMLPDLLHGEERKVWGDGGYPLQQPNHREWPEPVRAVVRGEHPETE
jgi:hypothetical protein